MTHVTSRFFALLPNGVRMRVDLPMRDRLYNRNRIWPGAAIRRPLARIGG